MHDIHPVNKRDVGLRFARLALADTYGRSDIPARGPEFQEAHPAGTTLEISFRNAEGLRTRDGLAPTHFEIAGNDRVYHAAEAKIAAGKVVVSSPDVAAPVAVRFGWHETDAPNLTNGAGLPATPFRTDDWPIDVSRPAKPAK
jgi:sialate O-acetylesterase